MSDTSNMRKLIMDMVKNKFGSKVFWRRREPEIAILCSNIQDDSITGKNKENTIQILNEIKQLLLEEGAIEEDLIFLDEEIERCNFTKQISLYVEDDDNLRNDLIDRYAIHGLGSEGIIGIHLPFNYSQLKRLTNGVYKKTGLIKFYISSERVISGQIIAEIYEHPQKVPIATLMQSKKSHKETGEPVSKFISLFGEKVNTAKYVPIKEIHAPFYVYRFISEDNRDYILLTTNRATIGDYIVTGVTTQVDDFKTLTNSSKLPTKLPYIFVHSLTNRIIQFADHGEFKKRLGELRVTRNSMFNYPFSMYNPKRKKSYVLKHPRWFKWLVWSWLTHQPKGMFNSYPLHLFMIGVASTGKSYLLNVLHSKSKERRNISSGAQSTLRSLIPSFKNNPAALGYLAESNRFAFLDEFFRCVTRTNSSDGGDAKESVFATMNDLLEHQKREAGSGVSRCNVNMTSRAFATSNPFRGKRTMEELLTVIDASFMSRWLYYVQKDDGEHVQMIRNANEDKLREYTYKLNKNDWISILDYLHSFSATYDMGKVLEIYEGVKPILSTELKKHYDSRHKHHIECIIDGIIKARCMMERKVSFSAIEEDYEILEDVWSKVISSWVDGKNIRGMDIKRRVKFLPDNCQFVFNTLCELKRTTSRYELESICLDEMSKREFRSAYIILRDNELLTDFDNVIKPHYMKEDGQFRL